MIATHTPKARLCSCQVRFRSVCRAGIGRSKTLTNSREQDRQENAYHQQNVRSQQYTEDREAVKHVAAYEDHKEDFLQTSRMEAADESWDREDGHSSEDRNN
jgi:hypothetical protein